MKLYSLYTASHEAMFKDWFLPSIRDDYDMRILPLSQKKGGDYRSQAWSDAVVAKSDHILHAIEENWGGLFVYSDCDITFYGQAQPSLMAAIEGHDIVCQRDDHFGQLCTGFFIARANERVKALWQHVRSKVETTGRDQPVFNRMVRRMPGLKWNRLGKEFFGAGCGLPLNIIARALNKLKIGKTPVWEPGITLAIPQPIIMHHANWTIGNGNKIKQLEYVRSVVQSRS